MILSDFNDGSALTMQQQALKRVREMQQRAQLINDSGGDFSQPERDAPPNLPPNIPNPQTNRQSRQNNNRSQTSDMFSRLFSSPKKGGASFGITELLKNRGIGGDIGAVGETVQKTIASVSSPIADLLDDFGIDGEKLIILLVMWAVFNDKKDNKTLLMALGYLLL